MTRSDTPRNLLIENVGVSPSGWRIDLLISNETEARSSLVSHASCVLLCSHGACGVLTQYRAFNVNVNGVKRQRGAVETSVTGYFGALNLLAPRSPLSEPAERWHSDATFVQLRFDFTTMYGHPTHLSRTFICACAERDPTL